MPDEENLTPRADRDPSEQPAPERSSLDRALAFPGQVVADIGRLAVPAWRAHTEGEHRWMVTTAVAVAIGLQLTLPAHLALPPWWLLPVLGAALLVGLLVANPTHLDRRSSPIRAASPTDVLPMAAWVKMTMMLRSAVSSSTVALVIARAVNILK